MKFAPSNEQLFEISQTFFSDLINSLTDPLFVKDCQHRWIWMNDAFCQWMGRSRSELLGKSELEFYPKTKIDEIWKDETQVLTTGSSLLNKESWINKQGYCREVLVQKSQFIDENKNLFLVGVIREISSCQEIESRWHQSQQILQQILDSLPQSIFWKDRNSVYLGCNLNFARDAGLDLPREIVGKTDYDLPWKREESDFYRLCDVQVMDANQSQLHIIETQKQADGNQVWLDTSKIPIQDQTGNVIGILGTYENITERKQTEIELQQLNKE